MTRCAGTFPPIHLQKYLYFFSILFLAVFRTAPLPPTPAYTAIECFGTVSWELDQLIELEAKTGGEKKKKKKKKGKLSLREVRVSRHF